MIDYTCCNLYNKVSLATNRCRVGGIYEPPILQLLEVFMSKMISLVGRSGIIGNAIVDDENFEKLNKYRWYLNKSRYAYTSIISGGKIKNVMMARKIMNCDDKKLEIDHINHNTLDNRVCNLRVVTTSQNNMNKRKGKGRNYSSKYKGVCWDTNNGKWKAYIGLANKVLHLGMFFEETKAALEYNRAAEQYFGEFAYLNVIEPPQEEGEL